MVLRCFGSAGVFAPWRVDVCFRWSPSCVGVGVVRFFFRRRRDVARFLWRLRSARLWWRSRSAPSRSVVGRSCVPRFGLRWLVRFPCLVCVFLSGVASFRSRLPSSRVVRRPGSRCVVGVRWLVPR